MYIPIFIYDLLETYKLNYVFMQILVLGYKKELNYKTINVVKHNKYH